MKLITAFTLALSFLWTVNSSASYGTKLNLDVDGSGSPAFGLTYIEDGNALWGTFTFRAHQIIQKSTLLTPVYISIVNRETNEIILPWTELGAQTVPTEPSQEIGFNFDFVGETWTPAFAAQFKKTVLLMSFQHSKEQAMPVAHIDFAELCQKWPYATDLCQ